MSTTGYILSAALILVVVRQLRGRRLAGFTLYLPLGIAAYVASKYLHTIPTHGNDLALEIAGIAVGLSLGIASGIATLVYPDHDGVPYARATWIAASLWVVGIGARLGFSLYAQHGGGATIARFSSAHALTMQAWVAGLILMAIAEVGSRTTVLIVRSRRMAPAAIIPAS